jgi:serine/threonine protein kinase
MGNEGDEATSTPKGAAFDDATGELRDSGARRAWERQAVANATTMRGSGDERNPLPELVPGTLLNGTYRVEECIGRGAMGAVYLVTHTGLDKKFAAKVVSGKFGAEPAALARLRNEARAASAIEHENIVNVTDLGQADGNLFVVMELLRGQDLRARLEHQLELAEEKKETPWLPDELSRDIVDQVLSALEAAHGSGIVHRDLKPENLFLSKRAQGVRAKIVDFGISKLQQSDSNLRLTATGQIIGTPLYMAPEQSRSTSEVDHRADIYSMGMIAYEMVTGTLPFEAANLFEIVLKHATEPPVPPRKARADLPEAVEQVILRCLEKEPARRFQSAGELRQAWKQAWEGIAPELPPSLRDSTTNKVLAIPGAKKTPLWPLAAIGVLVVGAVVAFAAWPDSEPARLPPDPPIASPEAPAEPPLEPLEPRALDPDPEPLPQGVEPAPIRRAIESTPAGATVTRDGTEIGVTPLELELEPGEEAHLELTLRGYTRESRTVTESDDATVQIALRRERRTNVPELAPR